MAATQDKEFFKKVVLALQEQASIVRTQYVNETGKYVELKSYDRAAGWQRIRVHKAPNENGKHEIYGRAEKVSNSPMAMYGELDL